MRILVVFESMFGATEELAEAIGKGLAGAAVEVVNVDKAQRDLTGVGLLVVGGPTHAHAMSRAATRKAAADQAERPTRSRTGVREWLDSLESLPAATFDTRVEKPRVLTGAASLGEAKRAGARVGAAVVAFAVVEVDKLLWLRFTGGAGREDRPRSWLPKAASRRTGGNRVLRRTGSRSPRR